MKKFLSVLNYNLFIIILFLFIFSFYGKSIIASYVNSSIKEIYTNENTIASSEFKDKYKNNKIFTSEEFNKVIDDSETQKLVNEFIDYSLESIAGDNVEFNTQEEIIEFLKQNKERLEQEYNVEISYQEIDNLKESQEFNNLTNQYDETINKVKTTISTENKQLVKAFNIICSTTFKIIAIILLLLDLIVYSLLVKSYYKWTKLLGIDLIICSITNIILGIVSKNIFNSKYNIDFNNSLIIKIGIIGLIIGIILVVVYIVLNKVLNKKQEVKDEVFEEYKEE